MKKRRVRGRKKLKKAGRKWTEIGRDNKRAEENKNGVKKIEMERSESSGKERYSGREAVRRRKRRKE